MLSSSPEKKPCCRRFWNTPHSWSTKDTYHRLALWPNEFFPKSPRTMCHLSQSLKFLFPQGKSTYCAGSATSSAVRHPLWCTQHKPLYGHACQHGRTHLIESSLLIRGKGTQALLPFSCLVVQMGMIFKVLLLIFSQYFPCLAQKNPLTVWSGVL